MGEKLNWRCDNEIGRDDVMHIHFFKRARFLIAANGIWGRQNQKIKLYHQNFGLMWLHCYWGIIWIISSPQIQLPGEGIFNYLTNKKIQKEYSALIHLNLDITIKTNASHFLVIESGYQLYIQQNVEYLFKKNIFLIIS